MRKIFTFILSFVFSSSILIGQIYYVAPHGYDNTGNGRSWTSPFKTLSFALNTVQSGEIWIAGGTYLTSSSYVISRGVAIYGGYKGSGTNPNDRDVHNYKTILTNNHFNTIIKCENVSQTIILDGLYIQDGGHTTIDGAGIYSNYSNVVIANCVIQGCVGNLGGGIYSINSTLNISNTLLKNNIAIYSGGGIYTEQTPCTITNTIMSGNNCGARGGAYFKSSGAVTMINCLISGNRANTDGGGICNSASRLDLLNCTIAGNYANENGGGITDHPAAGRPRNSTLYIRNSIVWGNRTAIGNSRNMYVGRPSNSTRECQYSLLEDCGLPGSWNTAYGTNLGGNIDANPLFYNYQYATNSAPTTAGNFRTPSSSPACNTGLNSLNQTLYDLDGIKRVLGSRIDMGAYEYPFPKSLKAEQEHINNNMDEEFQITLTYKLYPNPTHDYIILERNIANSESRYAIYSLLGGWLKEGVFLSGELIQRVDLSGLRSGTYLIRINDENKIITEKIIIK